MTLLVYIFFSLRPLPCKSVIVILMFHLYLLISTWLAVNLSILWFAVKRYFFSLLSFLEVLTRVASLIEYFCYFYQDVLLLSLTSNIWLVRYGWWYIKWSIMLLLNYNRLISCVYIYYITILLATDILFLCCQNILEVLLNGGTFIEWLFILEPFNLIFFWDNFFFACKVDCYNEFWFLYYYDPGFTV